MSKRTVFQWSFVGFMVCIAIACILTAIRVVLA